jgi:cytochrome c peroxidase
MPHILPVLLLLAGALFGADPGSYDWHLPKGFPTPLVPTDNPVAEPKVRLGRYLFYDARLSLNGKQSCSTCHRQELAFTDGRPTSQGATGQNHPRNAMSLVNVAYSAAFGWGGDPALHSLEQQALVPMLSEHPVELGMRSHEDLILNGLRSEPVYPEMFARAFPECAAKGNCFTVVNVARALATFVRTIISARSPYDRFHAGGDPDAISESAKRGETVFFSDPILESTILRSLSKGNTARKGPILLRATHHHGVIGVFFEISRTLPGMRSEAEFPRDESWAALR